MTGRYVLASLGFLLGACGMDDSQPVSVSDVTVHAPVPGQSTAVAYFLLTNRGPQPITLRDISSPDFDQVEMHATVVDGDITRMVPLDSITIAEGSEVGFEIGGRHLMLMQPNRELEFGEAVTLEFSWEPDGQLSVRAPLQPR